MRFMRRFMTVAALTAVGMFAAPSALALATFDPTCGYTPSNSTGACGFVGKGDVQTALGYNNTQLQRNAGSLAFTYSQPASQALSQDGTQTGTQSVSEDVSCIQDAGPITFHRDGTRDGSRAGSRSGSRTGSVNGSVSYTIAYDPRVKNQITGFKLTSATGGFVASGDAVWGDWSFGDWTWGNVNWGPWSPGDVNACLGGNPNVHDIVDSGVIEGAITEGAVTGGTVTYGAVTPSGDAHLYVNGVALN